MERFGVLMDYIMEFMKREYMIFGYSISMWQVYLFTFVGALIMEFIGGILSGD